MKNLKEFKDRNFVLKTGRVLQIGFGGEHLTNDNMTDDKAVAVLSQFPNLLKNFEKYPVNDDGELDLSAFKAKKTKAIVQTPAAPKGKVAATAKAPALTVVPDDIPPVTETQEEETQQTEEPVVEEVPETTEEEQTPETEEEVNTDAPVVTAEEEVEEVIVPEPVVEEVPANVAPAKTKVVKEAATPAPAIEGETAEDEAKREGVSLRTIQRRRAAAAKNAPVAAEGLNALK